MRALGGAPFALQQQNRRHLRQRFEHQHAGQRRRARKVALKEFFVDGDVLDGDETAARLVLRDRVDEHRRIPVAQPVQENGDVDHAPYGLGAGGRRVGFCRAAGACRRRRRRPPAWRAVAASKRLIASSVRSMPGSAAMMPASAALKSTCSPFSTTIWLRIGNSFSWKSPCSCVCSSVTSACASCSKRCCSSCLLLDVFLELRAGGLVHERTALLQLGLIVLQLLGLRRGLGLLLGDERLDLGRRRLAVDGELRNLLQVHEADLRALRETRPAAVAPGPLAPAAARPAAGPRPGQSPGRRSTRTRAATRAGPTGP